MSDKTSNLGPVYSGMSQEEMMNLINQAKALTASPEQQETARRIDEELDPGGVMRSRFQRPAPTAPAPVSKGLTATPQVQEPKEESDMFDFNAIKEYITNIFSSPSAPSASVPLKPEVRKEKEGDGGPASEPTRDDAFINIIKYYEGKPILKAKKPVKGDPYTIGYGRTRDLEGNPITKDTKITEEEADQMLREDLDSRMKEIKKAYPNFESYPVDLQLQITQSYYRGTLTPKHSPKTRRLINQGKFKEAATEFLDNEEYRTAKKRGRAGIRDRMEDVAAALRRMENTKKSSTGGRVASNPNPYEPRAI
jgi:GH24 family phage-related lysozyme (muramidase)